MLGGYSVNRIKDFGGTYLYCVFVFVLVCGRLWSFIVVCGCLLPPTDQKSRRIALPGLLESRNGKELLHQASWRAETKKNCSTKPPVKNWVRKNGYMGACKPFP